MTDNFNSVKEFSLQIRALHALVKACWGDFVIPLEMIPFDYSFGDEFDFVYEEKENIVAHRKTVVKRISEAFASTLPKILKDQLVDAVIRMQRGYHEALICTEMHSDMKTLAKPNPLTSGPYSAKNFIDPNGHFDELAWAKRFVSDENRSALGRFELSCLYCFEETIKDLWYSTISKGSHPYEGGFRDICGKSSFFVSVWVRRLQNKFDQEETEFADGFYEDGFIIAMDQNNEYASRFFWARCSDTEKSNLMSEIYEYVLDGDFFEVAFQGYTGFVNFIYSLLSLEQKRNIMLGTIEDYGFALEDIFSCLLLSPFYESVLNDIKTIYFPLSNWDYKYILTKLTSTMLELPIPEYKEIFTVLWKLLSQKQRNEIIDDTFLIRHLTKLKDMDLLETVIRPYPRSVKERMLLYDWKYAGMSALDELSEVGDYDAMFRYLLLFLMDRDPVTQILRVRDDATDLLDRLKSGDIFILRAKGQIPETKKREVSVIQSLQGTLHVLHTLLDRVEEIHSGGHQGD